MAAPKSNGPDASNDQPAKTLTKNTVGFIARCLAMVWSDSRLFTLALAVLAFILLWLIPETPQYTGCDI